MNEPGKLIARCEDIFEEMKKFYESHQQSCTGFNFSYSPKKSWEAMPNILLLTYHPAPQEDDVLKPHQVLWPEKNDFFNPSVWKRRTFPEGILTITAEIASFKEGSDYKPTMENTKLENFVNSNMVIASFIPFRTPKPTQDLENFSKEQYWCPIFQYWQPKVIIAVGDEPFNGVQETLKNIEWNVPEAQKIPVDTFVSDKIHGPCTKNYYYRVCKCTSPNLHTMHLLGVVSPSAYGFCGYPRKSRPIPKGPAPIQEFLKMELKHTDF